VIRLVAEIIPFGDIERKRTIGIMAIANKGNGTLEIGNYDYVVGEIDEIFPENSTKVIGELRGFERNQGFWKLVYLVLKEKFKDAP
jgi:hypothetical protein